MPLKRVAAVVCPATAVVLDQLAAGSPCTNMPAAVAIEGPLDHDLLRRVAAEVVRRHESLRYGFPHLRRRPAGRRIHPPAELDVEVEDP